MRQKNTKDRDQDGRPIDDARINKYEAMCHFMVRRYLPALSLYEASMDYSDLVNQCRYEVMMALANFSSAKALSSFRTKKALDEQGNPIILRYKAGRPVYLMIPDEEKRQSEVIRKSKDPQTALRKAEESIVYGRLNNYMRRVRWKFSPGQRGGKTISADMLMGSLADQKKKARLEFEFGYSIDPAPLMEFSATVEKERLLDMLEVSGSEEAKKAFDRLSEDMRASILEVIDRSQTKIYSAPAEGESEDEY